jgi:hypothetical protein
VFDKVIGYPPQRVPACVHHCGVMISHFEPATSGKASEVERIAVTQRSALPQPSPFGCRLDAASSGAFAKLGRIGLQPINPGVGRRNASRIAVAMATGIALLAVVPITASV